MPVFTDKEKSLLGYYLLHDLSKHIRGFPSRGLRSSQGYTNALVRPEKSEWICGWTLTAAYAYIKERKYSSVQKSRGEWMKIDSKDISFSDRKKAEPSGTTRSRR